MVATVLFPEELPATSGITDRHCSFIRVN